jgi:methionine-rich copper-binding protein CopC
MFRTVLAVAAGALFASPALAQHAHGQAHAGHDAHAGHGAHAGMKTTVTPADGSTVEGSPPALVLNFSHPMALQAVALTGPDGRTTALPVAPAAPAAEAKVAFPTLQPGAWRAAWKAVGADGHAMTGVVRFTVE